MALIQTESSPIWYPVLPDPPPGTGTGGGGGGGSAQVIASSDADPNGIFTPDDPAGPAIYYVYGASPAQWNWDPGSEQWYLVSTGANLQGNGPPLNVVTPATIGQFYTELDAVPLRKLWQALGLTSADWGELT